jgi:DNA-binding LacI/PurR family transcriptional regulator
MVQSNGQWRLTKSQEAYSRLTELAYRLGPDAKLPTIIELRDSLGVSKATLDGALQQLENSHIIYRKHGIGIFVSSQLRRRIALLCPPDFVQRPSITEFWTLLVQRAQERAASRGEQLDFHFVSSVQENVGLHSGLCEDVLSGKIHGALAMGIEPVTTQWLLQQGVPVVNIFAAPLNDAPTFNFDGIEMVRQATKALMARGCRRIELWKGVLDKPGYVALTTGQRRDEEVEEFISTLQSNRRYEYSPYTRYGSPTTAISLTTVPETNQGIDLVQQVFKARRAKPDGIVLTNDLMAQGVLIALGQMGIKVGRDVHIATLDNRGSPVLHPFFHSISRLEYDLPAFIELLFDKLERQTKEPLTTSEQLLVKPQLIEPNGENYF